MSTKTTPADPADQTTDPTTDQEDELTFDALDVHGCDRCGVDELRRPLRLADVAIITPAGTIGLCRSHEHQHSSVLAALQTVAKGDTRL